jgi:beta-glucosidase
MKFLKRSFVICLFVFCAHAEIFITSCTNWTLFPNIDFNSGDLPNQPVGIANSPQDCANYCCANSACFAFSMNANGACYLKASDGYSEGNIPGVQSGCFSGQCSAGPPIPPDTYFPWFNLSIPRYERLAILVANFTIPEVISWLNDDAPAINRLGLPGFSWEAEALHGVSWNGAATVFPENIAWGATWDVSLISEVAKTIALEARAKYVSGRGADGSSVEFAGLSFMTPNNNLFIDPSWGRGQETYGEEPILTAALTSALVHNLQFDDDDTTYTKMIATSKHFLAYHIESYKGDGQYRLSHSFNVSNADILQYYFVPFKAALLANVTAVMCSYDGLNGTNPDWPYPSGNEKWGTPSCAHPIMDTLLRDPSLNWQGYVITDEGSITFMTPGYHNYTNTLVEAACLSLNAGVDLALGGEFSGTLGTCYSQGNVTETRLRQALTRILKAQFDLGWFDSLAALRGNFTDPVIFNHVSDANVSTPAARMLSHRVASESLVLLKNNFAPNSKTSSRSLPIDTSLLKKLALVGPAANFTHVDSNSYIGNYPGCVNGPGGAITNDPRCKVISLLDELVLRSSSDSWTLSYAKGCDINTPNSTSDFPAAISAASGADIILFAGGLDTCQEAACSEGEANDRATDGGRYPLAGLDLGGSQLLLLEELRTTYPDTTLVVVLFNGGPISSPYTMQNADAILESWYGGIEAGPAIAEVLFGEVSPAGKMPVTVVTSMNDLPPHDDFFLTTPPGRTHRYFTGTPLTPFGFGLSYTNFSYKDLTITPQLVTKDDIGVSISATVTNTGLVSSDEVVQLYGHFEGTGAVSPPLQQLLSFERIYNLSSGFTSPIDFPLFKEQFELVDESGTLTVLPGKWTIWLGGGPPKNEQYGGGSVLIGSVTFE